MTQKYLANLQYSEGFKSLWDGRGCVFSHGPRGLCCCRSQGEFSGFSSFHSCQVPSHPFSLVSVCLLLNFYNWMQLIICWLGNQITEPARILYKGREKLGLCKCLRNSLTKQISWPFFTYVFKAKEMSVCLFARNIQICSNCCI